MPHNSSLNAKSCPLYPLMSFNGTALRLACPSLSSSCQAVAPPSPSPHPLLPSLSLAGRSATLKMEAMTNVARPQTPKTHRPSSFLYLKGSTDVLSTHRQGLGSCSRSHAWLAAPSLCPSLADCETSPASAQANRCQTHPIFATVDPFHASFIGALVSSCADGPWCLDTQRRQCVGCRDALARYRDYMQCFNLRKP